MSNKIFYYGEDGNPVTINLDKILFLKVVKSNVQFWESLSVHSMPITLDEILPCLPKGRFVKIHPCHAVAVDRVYKIEYDHILLNSFPRYCLPITRKYLAQLMDRLEIIRKVRPQKSIPPASAMITNYRQKQTG